MSIHIHVYCLTAYNTAAGYITAVYIATIPTTAMRAFTVYHYIRTGVVTIDKVGSSVFFLRF